MDQTSFQKKFQSNGPFSYQENNSSEFLRNRQTNLHESNSSSTIPVNFYNSPNTNRNPVKGFAQTQQFSPERPMDKAVIQSLVLREINNFVQPLILNLRKELDSVR